MTTEEEQQAKEEMEQFQKRLNRKPTKKEIENKINNEITNYVQVQGNINDINSLRPLYTKIFTENAKLNDKDILDILIENREKLKRRFTANLTVHSEEGIAGTLNITGVLIEETRIINDYIQEGQRIEYIGVILDNILNEFENMGAIGGSKTVNTIKPIIVKRLNITISYA